KICGSFRTEVGSSQMRCFGLEDFEGFPLRAVAPTHAHAHSYPPQSEMFHSKVETQFDLRQKTNFQLSFIIRVSLSFAFVIRYSLSFFLLFRIHIHHSHLSFILIHLSSSNIVSNSHSSQFSTLSRIDTRTYLRLAALRASIIDTRTYVLTLIDCSTPPRTHAHPARRTTPPVRP